MTASFTNWNLMHAARPLEGSRQFLTPYGVEFVEIPELEKLYIFHIGGPHTFRVVHMDGSSHPADPELSNYGHSVGWWEGDTLVIDTVGYNEFLVWPQRSPAYRGAAYHRTHYPLQL